MPAQQPLRDKSLKSAALPPVGSESWAARLLVTRIYFQISDTRLRVSSPRFDYAFEAPPWMAIDDAARGKIVAAIGLDALALRGRPNITVINPFAHPRTILGDYTVAEKMLQHAVRLLLHGRFMTPMILGILHCERVLEGGLTQVEHRALRELAENAGCGRAVVHEGPALSPVEVLKYVFPRPAR